MKRFWKKIGSERHFSVIYVAADSVSGAKFRLRGKKWHLTSYVKEPVRGESCKGAFRDVVRKVGTADYCAVTGDAAESIFFRFQSADLPDSAQRGAVEMELSRQVIRMPEKYAFQFAVDPVAQEDGAVGVNVTLYPQKTLDGIADLLTDCGCKADEFVFPFMAVSENLPQLYLPEIEKDYYFDHTRWMPAPADPEAREQLLQQAVDAAESKFICSGVKNFSVRENLPLLMVACVIASSGVSAVSSTLRVLPDRARLVRFRQHVILAALLALLLVVSLGWRYYRTHGKTIREHRNTVAAAKRLKAEASKIDSSVKRNAKENKEMARVAEMDSGNRVVIEEFALLSQILPADVLVTSMRWNDDSINMDLVCENDKIDLPALVQPLRRWRVDQLRQNQTNDSAVARITLTLKPLKDETVKEKKKK